ncbi:hypothetical protein F4860DRAFT_529744 [Xylaria cubensis]|nr:hypothetical protein F4860DRAFT_529744 [Xylaria cubensis]
MSATVTPSMRIAGWNVEFTIGSSKYPDTFAGIYQDPSSNLVTFRDVCDEMRLCFDLVREESSDDDDDTDNAWTNIAFSLKNHPDIPTLEKTPSFFVAKELLNQPVPSFPPTHPQKQNILRYHVVSHKDCDILSSRLDDHLKAGCAQQLSDPPQRYDRRYVPLTESERYDPKLSFMPFRNQLKSRSPTKRPRQQSIDDANETGFNDMLAPQNSEIDLDEAKRVESSFRSSCLNIGSCCVVSGEGNPWCSGMPIGPGVEACHIVPQRHYYLYPVDGDDTIALTQPSPRSLRLAWEKTWSFENGILLMKHFRHFFDARLFSIHPETLRIRVFVPYDALLRFNGQIASVPDQVDRWALQQHYEMSCIENMAAKKVYRRDLLGKANENTQSSPKTLGLRDTQQGTYLRGASDPSKKTQSTPPNQGQPSGQNNLAGEAEVILRKAETGYKRLRLQDREVDQTFPQYEEGMQDSYITPGNSRGFLADVNWELQRFKASQHARGNFV